MYIKSIRIEGFRNFSDTTVEFNEGVNIIIGHNNAGKSNLLKALSLLLDTEGTKRLEVDDFYKSSLITDLQKEPPRVSISLLISQSEDEDLMSDDLVTVAPWLVKLEQPYEALLTYHFFLAEEFHQLYLDKMSHVTTLRDGWLLIKHDFLKKYIVKIYGGKPELQSTADYDALKKFDYQFLNAIRDVERDMFTGRNSLLREVIDFFMDYDIKSDTAKDEKTKSAEIKVHKTDFSTDAQKLIQRLQTRMQKGREHIMKYAKETGAAFNNASPDFDGSVSEVEMYSALRLIISYTTGIEIPATHNGLGYNNLIYMSLLLAKMQVDCDGDYLGSNAKVFPVLVIEEPEAHLHPAMQYKFLKYLHSSSQTARQVFVTSHSPNITAAVGLDQIICFNHTSHGQVNIGYPGKTFTDDAAGKASKAYVQRFLDATRSDMLFARHVIMVEGLAEQLLLPTFARCISQDLEDHHTAVINTSGRYFSHFLQMFDSNKKNTIHKRVTCITDVDPVRKKKGSDDEFKQCYPFEYNADTANYDYDNNAGALVAAFASHPNIRYFSQDLNGGKTLEYELMFENYGSTLLLTDSLSNTGELKKLFAYLSPGKTLNDISTAGIMRKSEENDRILTSLANCTLTGWDEATKIRALIAARYLNSIGKGGNALELSQVLEDNLLEQTPVGFNVPTYLKDAITWSCQ